VTGTRRLSSSTTGEKPSREREEPTGFLVAKAKDGNQDAWDEIFRRYKTMLVVQIRARISGFARRRFDEEDVLQRAFTKAWIHIGSFEYRTEGSLRCWLATLVSNEFQNLMRAQRKERERAASESQVDRVSLVPDAYGEERRQREQDGLALLQQMGRLRAEDRDLLTMRNFEFMTFRRIGEVLACTEKQARSQYDRAIARLQRLLV
jgi:RNA polymerase sigma-70 factor, ECF subfamily